MLGFRAFTVLVAAALGGITPALAATLSGTADPGLGSVQWSSTDQPTYARYDVTIQNTGQAAISGWRFRARTSVADGTGTPTATFNKDFSDPACDLLDPAVQTEIVCDFSTETLRPMPGTRSFSVVFNAPTSGTEIDFSWRVFWDESGNGGQDGFRDATPTTLYAPNPDQVSSVVPANAPALTFFTGGGVATGPLLTGDNWVTRVRLPANASTASTALVVDSVTSGGLAADLLTVSTSDLTIPGTFCDPTNLTFTEIKARCLEVTLLRDATTISRGARIESAIIYYFKEGETAALPGDIVLSCDDTSYGKLPQAGRPCEDRAQRFAFPARNKRNAPIQYDIDFLGDWKFVIYQVDNGRITN